MTGEITKEMRQKMRAAEEAKAAELGIPREQMTRMIVDPEEAEAQRKRHEGRQRFAQAVLFRPIKMSIRSRAKMNGSPASHHAVQMGSAYPAWLKERETK